MTKVEQGCFFEPVERESRAYKPPTKTVVWETPQWLFDLLDKEFKFTMDAAADPNNAKCPFYCTEKDDGLKVSWHGHTVWCNPPYDHARLTAFVKRAFDNAHRVTSVLLVPVKSDQAWWHDYAIPRAEIRHVRGRLKFGGAKHDCPVPIAVLVFGPNIKPHTTTLEVGQGKLL